MVSEDSREPIVLKSFLLIFRRDVCASHAIELSLLIPRHYPLGVTRNERVPMNTPGFPAYGQLHSRRRRREGQPPFASRGFPLP